MALNHDCPVAGHLGQKKTCARLLQGFYCYGIREDVNHWVLQCHTCGQVKPPVHPQRNTVGQMPVGGGHWIDWPQTFWGPCLKLRGETGISWWSPITLPSGWRFSPSGTKWSPTCAGLIPNQVIARFGCTYDIHSDQGRNYESYIFQELC